MRSPKILGASVRAFCVPLNEPFAIAGGAKTKAQNIIARVDLGGGIRGWGEGAPPFNDGSRKRALKAADRAAKRIIGRPIASYRALLEIVDDAVPISEAPARAAVGMAVMDAWSRWRHLPLRMVFGGAQDRVTTDVTVTLDSPDRAAAAARRIAAMGVRVIKIKIGADMDEDEARVHAVYAAAQSPAIILDANCGYTAEQSIRFLARLRKAGIRPALFEQPAPKEDWAGLRAVLKTGKVRVAGDESISSRKDMIRAIRERAVDVVNIKLMKSGLLEAWDIALVARAAGVGLMIGGMVESPLAMGAGAHFAAGIGGFDFIDLDTPLWFAKNPMRGLGISRGGIYDLSNVTLGIGVSPGPEIKKIFAAGAYLASRPKRERRKR
ncbi:MAG: dipeptide epimerase [Elusimicrobiota bacterium]